MIFSVKKLFAQWFLNDFFQHVMWFLKNWLFVRNLECLKPNFLIQIRRIVFSRSFFETDWVESAQCENRQILWSCDYGGLKNIEKLNIRMKSSL